MKLQIESINKNQPEGHSVAASEGRVTLLKLQGSCRESGPVYSAEC